MTFLNKRYILMDLDGTITDPAVGITKSVQYALEHFGIIVSELSQLYPFIGPPLKKSFIEYYHLTDLQAEQAITKYREYFSEKGIYENEVYDKIESFLQACCRQDKKLIVATSKPTPFAETILKHFHLRDYFTAVCGSNLDGTRSDKDEVIQYALSSQQIINRDEAIMIGDRKHDIIGALKNKINSIGVLYGYGSREELIKAGADELAENIHQLQEFIIG